MSVESNASRLELIASLPAAQRASLLQSLSDAEANAILYDWRGFIARRNQIQPAGDWVHWILLAGRGFGKTKTGAETVREWAKEKLPAPIHLVAPTAADIRKVMIEGPSGILSCYPAHERPHYEPSKGHLITWPNGNIAYAFSADEPARLRGPQCCRYWADELCAWNYAQEAWDNLMFGFRIGDSLRGIITTTPRPIQLLRDLLTNPASTVTRGTTYDNRRNLAKAFFAEVIRKYEGTRTGRQELMGELLEDFPGALWTRSMIESARIRPDEVKWDMIVRIVVAIDPAVSANEDSDETGIITAALTRSEHILILDDDSCKESPLGWARAAVARYKMRKADRIVAEVNNGGDLVAANLYTVAPEVPFRAVRASRGKAVRAEPVAAMYEQGRVHHVGLFPTLEDQLCEFVPGLENQKSPDRMDALVWAVTELVVDPEVQELTMIRERDWYTISPI
jgi:phage terminase large subunit-like protein